MAGLAEMGPVAASMNVGNGGLANAVSLGKFVLVDASGGQSSNLTNLLIREAESAPPENSEAVMHVLLESNPLQIPWSVIRAVAILVIAHRSWRARSDEGFQDEVMNVPADGYVGAAHANPRVMTWRSRLGAQNLAAVTAASARIAPYLAFVRNRVAEVANRSPFHGTEITMGGVASQG